MPMVLCGRPLIGFFTEVRGQEITTQIYKLGGLGRLAGDTYQRAGFLKGMMRAEVAWTLCRSAVFTD